MRTLQKFRKDNKGFTLVELLIVVAIIAILVAVSIPLITGSLDRARVSADMANERSAEAAAKIYLMTEWDGMGHRVFYRAETGTFESNPGAENLLTPYGQCDRHKGCVIQINISDDGAISEFDWIELYGADAGDYEGIPKPLDFAVPPHNLDGSVPAS